MADLLRAAQMREIEQTAIASGAVTGLTLMERAGQGVVDAILTTWPALAKPGQRAVVLCGPGNNGGDGFVIARLLKSAGWSVAVFLFGVPAKLPPDARSNHDRWSAMGTVVALGFPAASPDAVAAFCDAASLRPDRDAPPVANPPAACVVIDALFGTGLTRPISGLDPLCAHWGRLASSRDPDTCYLVSVDIPSGLSSDTGEILYPADSDDDCCAVLFADLTVTFHRMKHGHVRGAGPTHCGKVVVADIGL